MAPRCAAIARPEGLRQNSPIPRPALFVEDGHDDKETLIYAQLKTHRTTITTASGARLRVVRGLSVEAIALALGLSARHVIRKLASLAAKHSIQPYEVEDRRGRRAASYLLPSPEEVLAARRADPKIGQGPRKLMWVFGRNRRFLSPEEVAAWKLAEVVPEGYPPPREQWPLKSELRRERAPQAARQPGPQAVESPPESPPGANAVEVPEVIRKAFKDTTANQPASRDAAQTIATAVQYAAQRGLELSLDAIANLMYTTARYASGGVRTYRYFLTAIPDRLDVYFEQLKEERKEQARAEAEQTAAAARDYDAEVNEYEHRDIGEMFWRNPSTPPELRAALLRRWPDLEQG